MSDDLPDSGDHGRCRASRRDFLLTAGAVGVAGAMPASAAERTGASSEVAVDGSPTQRLLARAAADRVRRTRDGASVEITVSGTTPALDRFVHGEVDAVATNRPILPAEAARATANDVDYTGREIPLDRVALRYRSNDWYDPLSPRRIARQWAGDGEVETWSEVAPPGSEGAVAVDRSTREGTPDDAGPGAALPPPDDRTALVRGRREFQHDAGFGGVGYYEPPTDRLVDPSGDTEDPDESHAPLVRLLYLYVDRESLRRPEAAAFARTYAAGASSVRYFRDPHASRTSAATPFEPR